MTEKTIAAHFRKRLAHNGIKAKASMQNSCGSTFVRVSVSSFDARWTAEEIHEICLIAIASHLTFVRGIAIDPVACMALTEKMQFEFYV